MVICPRCRMPVFKAQTPGGQVLWVSIRGKVSCPPFTPAGPGKRRRRR